MEPAQNALGGGRKVGLYEARVRHAGGLEPDLAECRSPPQLGEGAAPVADAVQPSVSDAGQARPGFLLAHRCGSCVRVRIVAYSARAACQSRSGPPGSGVGASTPQGGGVEGRGHVRERHVPGRHRHAGEAQHFARPLGPGRVPAVDHVMDAAYDVPALLAGKLHQARDRRRQVRGVGRAAEFVRDQIERPVLRPSSIGSRQDLGREVCSGRPEEPRRPHDRQGRNGGRATARRH